MKDNEEEINEVIFLGIKCDALSLLFARGLSKKTPGGLKIKSIMKKMKLNSFAEIYSVSPNRR